MKNKVDVVIPTYNMEKFVVDAIRSALDQGRYVDNIIIVDDGSTDNTKKKIKKLKSKKIRYIYQKNKGLSEARNTGIKKSKSNYIAFLDADDIWKKNKIKLQLEIFNNSKFNNLGVVYSNYEDININKKKIRIKSNFRLNKNIRGSVYNSLLNLNYIAGSGSAVLIKRECFEKVGLFDEKLSACEDWDMWIRIASKYDFDFVDKVLVSLRRHKKNMQNNEKHMLFNNVIFFNKFIEKNIPIPFLYQDYLQKKIKELMMFKLCNISFLYKLKKNMSKKLYNQIWPKPIDIFKSHIFTIYKKLKKQ